MAIRRSIRLGVPYFEQQYGMGFVIVLERRMLNSSWRVEVRLPDYHLPLTILMCFFLVLSVLSELHTMLVISCLGSVLIIAIYH